MIYKNNKIAKIILKKGLPEGIDILNVNVPENPSDEEFEIAQQQLAEAKSSY